MGLAAYNRGNAAIRRQIDEELRASPVSGRVLRQYEADHLRDRVTVRLGRYLNRALSALRRARVRGDMEARRAAAVLAAVERTYDEARAAGLTADDRGMYWMALARHRARRADPGATE